MRELLQRFGAQEWTVFVQAALHIVLIVALAWLLQRGAAKLIGLARDHVTRRVHYVPNGAITTVTNRSRGFAYAVIEVGIAYREMRGQAFKVMRRVGRALREDTELGPRTLDDLEIAGVDRWADSAVILRCRMKTLPLQQWGVRRAFLKQLKQAFDEASIKIPFPHMTVYAGEPKAGSAAPFQFRTGTQFGEHQPHAQQEPPARREQAAELQRPGRRTTPKESP